jgi:hypothetical protein
MDMKTRPVFLILLLVSMGQLWGGCGYRRTAGEVNLAVMQMMSPVMEAVTQSMGNARQVGHCLEAFHRKHDRWPESVNELEDFVRASDGLVVLPPYDEFLLVFHADGGLTATWKHGNGKGSWSRRMPAKSVESKL